MVTLNAGHVSAGQTTGAHYLDALDLWLTHRGLDCLAHSATEGNAVHELLSDRLGNQGGVGVDLLDLEDVQRDHLAGQLLQLTADAVSFGTTTADNDARTSSVDVDADAIASALDYDVCDAGTLKSLGQEITDLDVFGHVVCVVFFSKPVGIPVSGNTQT